MQPIRVVAQNCSREHPISPTQWLNEGVPYRDGDPTKSYRVRSADGAIEGWLGPVLSKNAEGRAPYRPVDVRGFGLVHRHPSVFELQVLDEDPVAVHQDCVKPVMPSGVLEEDDGPVGRVHDPAGIHTLARHVARSADPDGFYFGSRLFTASLWTNELNTPGRVIWKAEGPLPGFESAAHAAPRCVVRLRFRPGSKIVEISVQIRATYSFTKGTFPKMKIPALLWKTKASEIPHVDWTIERGGGDVLTTEEGHLAVIQPEFELGAGQEVEFLCALHLGHLSEASEHDRVAWLNRTTGGAELVAHHDEQLGNLVPYGSLGGKLHPNDDPKVERERVMDAFENMLFDQRREVALGGAMTRTTFTDPGWGEKFASVCRPNPSGQGWMAAFGHTLASLTYADGVGFPYMKRILRYYQLWDKQRAIHWFDESGPRYDPMNRLDLAFFMGAPHTDPHACPMPLGLPQHGNRTENSVARHYAGGMVGFDRQHWTVNSLAQLYLHELDPRLRDHADSLTCSYLAECPSGEDENNPLADVDATRSWRAEGGAAILYALTGDERIPKRFAQRLPIYARPGYWDRRNPDNAKRFVPFIEAARNGLSIVRPYVHGRYDSQLARDHSPEWEATLGLPRACDMARIIRQSPDAVAIAKEVGKATGLGENLLEDFEKAIGIAMSQWLTETGFGKGGVLEVIRAVAWPKEHTDGWPEGWYAPDKLYVPERDNGDASKLFSSTSHYSAWALLGISSALDPRVLGRVVITDEAKAAAKKLLAQSEQLFLQTPSRHRVGYLQDRSKWIV